jgi:hypothetical protein
VYLPESAALLGLLFKSRGVENNSSS